METDKIHVMNDNGINAMEISDITSSNENEPIKFFCKECPKSFQHMRSLKRHVASLHPQKVDEFSKVKTAKFSCCFCSMAFHKLYLLKNHKAKEHRAKTRVHKCVVCSLEFAKKELLTHYGIEHGILMSVERLEFPNETDFFSWKEHMERLSNSLFIKTSGTKSSGNGTTCYFQCHRSGYYEAKGNNERQLKTQGSNKINSCCPANIKLVKSSEGICSVFFMSKHVGHKNELSHIFLPSKDKEIIAAKIAARIPFDTILDEIRDGITNAELERIHLLTKKDLYNIEKMYSLQSSGQRHVNDAVSVDAWVKEMQHSCKDNCVVHYKPQSSVGDGCLKDEDFVLIIMTDAQKEILKKFGSDVVCMDGTHGLNSYGFELITLLVLDDAREGFPSAFLISNRTDEGVISFFLSKIKEKVGEITPNIFMSDMGHAFYNAWVKVMCSPEKRLFCTWHVDQAWRKNLIKIKDVRKQAETYKILRTLLMEKDTATFEIMLQNAVTFLSNDPITEDYGRYFSATYLNCSRSWAYCYRLHAGINTNMHLERMHKTLKYIYLNGKHVKRLDKAIHAIMHFIRDKIFDRIIMLHKGKITYKIKELRKRHKLSLQLNREVCVNEDGFLITSSTCDELYTIKKMNRNCNCPVRCNDCNSCIHEYICSCIDSAIRWNMCKHIHFICMFTKTTNDDCEENLIIDESATPNTVEQTVLAASPANETSNFTGESNVLENNVTREPLTFSQQREKLREYCNTLLDSLVNNEELNVARMQMSSIMPIVTALRNNISNTTTFDTTSRIPANKKIEQQRKFFNTRKKMPKSRKNITVPSANESQVIALNLLSQNRDSLRE